MKKILGFLLLLGLFATPAHAYKDAQSAREDGGTVKYFFNDITASTAGIIIDLSDTTNFPHRHDGHIVITSIHASVDKVAASSGTVRCGVVTAVNASSGTIKFFWSFNFDRDSVGTRLVDRYQPPNPIRLYVDSSGLTPFLQSNDLATASTVYQTDVGLPTTYAAAGAVFPAVGDIIFRVDLIGTTAIDITVEISYYSER